MPTPFPGMDPYLEHPRLWPDVHNALIAAIRADLTPRLRPRYVARLQERAVTIDPDDATFIPDVSVRPEGGSVREPRGGYGAGAVSVSVPMPEHIIETWIEVHAVHADEEILTVVEVLSPGNKRPGSDARKAYERKRHKILFSETHLVEIDLCRSGAPMPVSGKVPPSDYRIFVSRAEDRPRAALYPFGVRDPFPSFVLPLRADDDEPPVDLHKALARVWDEGAFDLSVNYRAEAVPPLRHEDAAWAREITQRRATA